MPTRKKKALMVSTILSFLTTFEISDIKILQKFGYEVHCASNMDDCEDDKRLQSLMDLGVIYHHISFTRSPFSLENVKAYRDLKILIEKGKFELIHCHTPVGGVLGRIAAHKYSVPTIFYTAHGFHFFEGAPLKNWLYYPIEKHLSRYTDVLITINSEDYGRALKDFHAKRTFYIPGVGVDVKKFSDCKVDKQAKRFELGVKADDFLLLSVGELSDRKNQEIVIKSIAKMKMQGTIKNIVYLVVGNGYKENDFKGLIRKGNLEDCVKLLGHRSDINELCKTVDCFVHPSVREGLGIAPLEAMAAGLPLIYADVNGIRDYAVQGKSGIGVNPRSMEQMIIAITFMYKNAEFRKACGIYNRISVGKFDINNVQKLMKKIYGI